MPESSNEIEPYINAEQAAEYLGIKRQSVYNKVAAGELPHYKRDGLLRFKRSELDAWLRGQPAPGEEPGAPAGAQALDD